jgi:hypothetical protein
MLDYSIANNIIRRLMSAIILHMPAFKDRPWQFLYCAQVLPFNRRINIGAPPGKKVCILGIGRLDMLNRII